MFFWISHKYINVYNYIYTNLQECEKKQKRIKKEMFCNIELI